MLFNSLEFLIFFPIVTLLFYLLPHKWRWFLLLAASCFFYMWFIPKYILILLITIAIDYSAGILIEKMERPNPTKENLPCGQYHLHLSRPFHLQIPELLQCKFCSPCPTFWLVASEYDPQHCASHRSLFSHLSESELRH